MSQTGSLLVRVFTSRAQIPVPGATVVVSAPEPDGRFQLLSVQMTNSSGVAGPIVLDAPDKELSQQPGSVVPFASYMMLAEHPDYRIAAFQGLQVFSGVESVLNVALIPLAEPVLRGEDNVEMTVVTPQDL